MESRKSFLAILALILTGSLIVSGDYAFAKKAKKNTAKKSTKKEKKKNKKNETVAVSTEEELSEERASTSSTARRGSSSSTTSTTTTTTAVDETTEISNLFSNLLGCLSGQCAGDVPFEKCFKTANIETFLAANGNCKSYLNSASSETIRVLAKQKVTAKIKEYFKENCEGAGGKISNETCKLDLYYYAKSADGKHSKLAGPKAKSIGTTFTCTYGDFGLSQQDLEYKPEMSAEDKIQMIQSGIQLGTGLLNTGIQAFQAIKASKDAKRAEAFDEDAWYKFDGKTLTKDCAFREYTYGNSGAGLSLKEQQDLISAGCKSGAKVETDSNGAKYCVKTSDLTCETKHESDICGTGTNNKIPCYVKIEKANDIKRAEKTSELIRTINDLDKLKQDAAKEQQNNAIASMFVQSATGNIINSMANQGFTQGGGATYCSNEYSWTRNEKCGLESNDFTIDNRTKAEECLKEKIKSKGAICEEFTQGYYTKYACISSDTQCTWDKDQKRFIEQVTNSNYCLSTNNTECKPCTLGQENCVSITTWNMTAQVGTMKTNYEAGITAIQGLQGLVKTENQEKYNSAVSAYTTNQNSLNAKKKEVEELKEQSSSALQNVISTGTQTLLTGATTMITSKLSADSNRESMTGGCYIGNPTSGGSYFLREGESKKLNWKLFN